MKQQVRATLPDDDPRAVALREAIHTGDVAGLRAQLAGSPELATIWLRTASERGDEARSLLHVVADWPGHLPRCAETVAVLAAAGADVNARFVGGHTETPLHWAASADDVAVLDALLDAGADIDARGAVIAGGTALADATAFGQWGAARRLLERGARPNLWEAAALGLVDRVRDGLGADPPPTPADVTGAFWGACHGGQRGTAELLLDHGADIDWQGWDGLTPLEAAERGAAHELADWLRARGALRSNER